MAPLRTPKYRKQIRPHSADEAFVDIGVHQDGLIHISQLADQYVQDPSDVVSVGDVVRVKVLEVNLQRRRIAVSRKMAIGSDGG